MYLNNLGVKSFDVTLLSTRKAEAAKRLTSIYIRIKRTHSHFLSFFFFSYKLYKVVSRVGSICIGTCNVYRDPVRTCKLCLARQQRLIYLLTPQSLYQTSLFLPFRSIYIHVYYVLYTCVRDFPRLLSSLCAAAPAEAGQNFTS